MANTPVDSVSLFYQGLNAANPTASPPFSPTNVTLGTPQPNPDNTISQNSMVQMSGPNSSPYSGTATVYFNRVSLQTVQAAVPNASTIRFTGQANISDALPQFNAAYGVNVLAADIIDGPLPKADPVTGQIVFSVVAQAGSLSFTGQAPMLYRPDDLSLASAVLTTTLTGPTAATILATPVPVVQALLTQVNKDNATISRLMSQTNISMSDPTVLTGDSSGKNSSMVLTGITTKGFTDTCTIRYNRVGLLDLVNASANPSPNVPPNNQQTTADMLASFNSRYGARLTMAELTNNPTDPVVQLPGGYYGSTLTPVANHPLYNAPVTVQYRGSFTTLAISAVFSPDAVGGKAYTSSVPLTGGAMPYANPRVTIGTLPTGMSLTINGSNLVLSGTTPAGAKTYNFTVAVDSDDAQTAVRYMVVRVDGGVVTATFVDGVAKVTLTDASKTATKTGGASEFALGPVVRVNRGVGGNTPAAGIKRYFEVLINQTQTGGNVNNFVNVGFAAQSTDPTARPGSTNNSWGWWADGRMSINNSTNNPPVDPGFSSGLVLGIAVEYLSATQVRFHGRIVGAAWNRGGVPGTSTGAITVVNLPANTPIEFRAQFNSLNDSITILSDPGELRGAPPAGFTAGYL